jgi:hypothetical protein
MPTSDSVLHRRPALLVALALSLAVALTGCSSTADPAPAAFDALVFSKTEGFRHASIPDGIAALRELGAEHGFNVTATEDASAFTPDGLRAYDVIVFLNTTGDVLNTAQQAALQQYIRGGGGFVGVHAATDTEYDWPWYNRLVGAYFDGHPSVQEASITVVDTAHASTRMLPQPWVRRDEWYSFRSVQDGLNILLNLDEDSYDLEGAPAMGDQHPVAWYRAFEGGRSWYTELGHTKEAYREPLFREHLLGGIQWAARVTPTASH